MGYNSAPTTLDSVELLLKTIYGTIQLPYNHIWTVWNCVAEMVREKVVSLSRVIFAQLKRSHSMSVLAVSTPPIEAHSGLDFSLSLSFLRTRFPGDSRCSRFSNRESGACDLKSRSRERTLQTSLSFSCCSCYTRDSRCYRFVCYHSLDSSDLFCSRDCDSRCYRFFCYRSLDESDSRRERSSLELVDLVVLVALVEKFRCSFFRGSFV